MDLTGATLRAGELTYPVVAGAVKSLDSIKAEVRGQFELGPESAIARGHPSLTIEAALNFEVKLLTSVLSSDGVRRYRFVATCSPEACAGLDLMLNPVKHPTALEQLMR